MVQLEPAGVREGIRYGSNGYRFLPIICPLAVLSQELAGKTMLQNFRSLFAHSDRLKLSSQNGSRCQVAQSTKTVCVEVPVNPVVACSLESANGPGHPQHNIS